MIATAAGPNVAFSFIGPLEDYCRGMVYASAWARRRDDVRPGLRIVGFERRVAVAFSVNATTVTILRLFHGGQHWERQL